jgi:hypothetical protein
MLPESATPSRGLNSLRVPTVPPEKSDAGEERHDATVVGPKVSGDRIKKMPKDLRDPRVQLSDPAKTVAPLARQTLWCSSQTRNVASSFPSRRADTHLTPKGEGDVLTYRL